MKRIWILSMVAVACGGTPHEETVVEAQLPNAPETNDEESVIRGALEALGEVRGSGAVNSAWRPSAVVRLDDSLAVLDDSHAFVWEEDTWRHIELPGPAPFRVGSMGRPTERVKADGHRAIFAGPSAPDAQSIALFQLTRAGVEELGVLPDWVAACPAFVASGTHLFAVVSDEAREREGTILHAEAGAAASDWQPLTFVFRSNQPDREMLMTPEGGVLLNQDDGCQLLLFPSEGLSFEPTPLLSIPNERGCEVHVSDGLTPERIIITGDVITIAGDGEPRSVDWPEGATPFDDANAYDDYDTLTASERAQRENDSMARTMSPGLVAFQPLLFERFHPAGELERDQGAFRLPMSSAFYRNHEGEWVALPEQPGEPFAMLAAMHAGMLTRPSWSSPVNWGPFRIAVATGQWANETPAATLRVWRADSPELVVSLFPSPSRR